MKTFSHPHKGFFVVFEGGEGGGKSTQIELLADFLISRGQKICKSFEPGGTTIGNKIRELLIDPKHSEMDSRCEALLYAASRAQHVSQVIKPALEQGRTVLCDRYIDASRAYQGVGRALGTGPIESLNHWATHGLLPDKVFVFDLDIQSAFKRAKLRAAEKQQEQNDSPVPKGLDRMESLGDSFHTKVREAYLHLAALYPEKYFLIDASASKEHIQDILQKEVSKWLSL